MPLKMLIFAMLLAASTLSSASTELSLPGEEVIPGGRYYVGQVFGHHEYRLHGSIALTSFSVMKTEVSYAFYHSLMLWASSHGYVLNQGCNGSLFEDCQSPDVDDGQHPVTSVSWWDAVLFANAYSEYQSLPPYYLSSSGHPLKAIPENGVVRRAGTGATGYRLPTQAEWEIAARGGEKGLNNQTYGAPSSGSYNAAQVANFPLDGTKIFATEPVASRKPNAAGLFDMSGNVSEWLDEPYAFEQGPVMYFFCGGSYLAHTRNLASCDMHTPGFLTPDTGFRLIRRTND